MNRQRWRVIPLTRCASNRWSGPRGLRARLRFALGRQSPLDAIVVDDHALMRAAADLLGLVAGAEREFDAPPVDLGHFRLGADALSDRRRRQMPYLDRRAERGLLRLEKRADGVERGILP